MANRRRPIIVATRVDAVEKKILDAGCAAAGLRVTDFVRRAILEAARQRLLAASSVGDSK